MAKKTYTKTGKSCRVIFELPAAAGASYASVLGDFNEWSADAHPMKRRKDGSFFVVIYLKPGREYRYRYLLDGKRWENDWNSERYAPNEFGSEDSVVSV